MKFTTGISQSSARIIPDPSSEFVASGYQLCRALHLRAFDSKKTLTCSFSKIVYYPVLLF